MLTWLQAAFSHEVEVGELPGHGRSQSSVGFSVRHPIITNTFNSS
jgi:hypothetical protein